MADEVRRSLVPVVIVAEDRAERWRQRVFGPFDTHQAAERERARLTLEFRNWRFRVRALRSVGHAEDVLL